MEAAGRRGSMRAVRSYAEAPRQIPDIDSGGARACVRVCVCVFAAHHPVRGQDGRFGHAHDLEVSVAPSVPGDENVRWLACRASREDGAAHARDERSDLLPLAPAQSRREHARSPESAVRPRGRRPRHPRGGIPGAGHERRRGRGRSRHHGVVSATAPHVASRRTQQSSLGLVWAASLCPSSVTGTKFPNFRNF